MTIKNIAVLTSGGDAPGMNAAIRAVVLAAHHYALPTIGFFSGYNGLIEASSTLLTPASVNGIIHRGGTILKSARCPAMLTEQGLKSAAATLRKEQIDALIVIGGDGSFNGLLALNKYWSGAIIGIPGTIDNDIDGTDFTIGFSTAVNTGIEAIDKIRDTAEAFERIFIVEVMGRRSGHITFNVGIASAAEQILSFENFSQADEQEKLSHLAKEIKQAQHNRHASYIIVIAENLWPGGAVQLAKQLKQTANIDCTACILGYIQRGGSPVAKDRILATKMGVAAVQALIAGKSNVMIGERNNQLLTVPLDVAVQHKEKVSESLVSAQENILGLTAQ
ncbi:6-phosphofructokinase [Colwellia sp. BRX8-4]|uniref:ATP-dependent 6-phosphofructokinase n=1 Tax=Colwellia sp. BRX8-4 TaxID=2759836 RepID=UPI0015F41BC8|nr:ATP-dependent 6-phosphofructokinase [Colwellia sp. BRX8-4]MBA6363670.1 6-phosphofructokinase [Colwellia sp. BRX8-8]MBA6372323.1 6-phosphofructokinase [Colwellia sp. BRX8-4]